MEYGSDGPAVECNAARSGVQGSRSINVLKPGFEAAAWPFIPSWMSFLVYAEAISAFGSPLQRYSIRLAVRVVFSRHRMGGETQAVCPVPDMYSISILSARRGA